MSVPSEGATLRLSEVARLCGIEVSNLRKLVEDDQLPGVVRGRNGHVQIREDAVPAYGELVAMLEAQLARHLGRAKNALDRIRVEIEAVDNDIAAALEHPYEPLGDDLSALRSYARSSDATTLTSALLRLELAALDVRTYSEAVRRAHRFVINQPDREASR